MVKNGSKLNGKVIRGHVRWQTWCFGADDCNCWHSGVIIPSKNHVLACGGSICFFARAAINGSFSVSMHLCRPRGYRIRGCLHRKRLASRSIFKVLSGTSSVVTVSDCKSRTLGWGVLCRQSDAPEEVSASTCLPRIGPDATVPSHTFIKQPNVGTAGRRKKIRQR